METLINLAIIDANEAKERKANRLSEADFLTKTDALKSLEKL